MTLYECSAREFADWPVERTENDTPWGPEVDAQQDAETDAEYEPALLDKTCCPECGINWRGVEIPTPELFGGSLFFGANMRGIEILGQYDGVYQWECLGCGARWDRWTEQRIQGKVK